MKKQTATNKSQFIEVIPSKPNAESTYCKNDSRVLLIATPHSQHLAKANASLTYSPSRAILFHG
jgi:hypothetical protein